MDTFLYLAPGAFELYPMLEVQGSSDWLGHLAVLVSLAVVFTLGILIGRKEGRA